MNPNKSLFSRVRRHNLALRLALGAVLVFTAMAVNTVRADVPGGRPAPFGAEPNPGTQEQELANITLPAPYNVFEFTVTCAGCHGGFSDLQTSHFGNWAGTAMANSMRDPIFRANQQIVNQLVLDATGQDGGGNVCIKCHSPNAWYSGRTDPAFGGKGDTSTVEHSILLSTDDEGILCEFCHRAIGNVTMRDPELVGPGYVSANDPVWNMMAGISDWPHAGNPYPNGPADGNPYGDASLQIADGWPYAGKYPGTVQVMSSDVPMAGTTYSGQTYAILAPGMPQYVPAGQPATNPAGQRIAYAPDGSVSTHLEAPVGPTIDPATGYPNYQNQAISLEHPTSGQTLDANGNGAFVTTSEFCGSCHDITVPVLNHGMAEQRTYTEWKYSDYGNEASADYQRCQDCHMPEMKAEYSDEAAVTVNADPLLTGWWPYAKDRNPDGGISFHKFEGSNLDLPQMMALLYPEVDMEVVGAPTGNDNRLFGGMLSGRDTMWDRALRNNQVSMSTESASIEVLGAPTYNAALGKWEVQVKVTNNGGHSLPSGYPDGRRLWVGLTVKDNAGNPVYTSGYYNQDTATLYNDASQTGFKQALTNVIDSADNAVMIYGKVTGNCTPAQCIPSVDLLNTTLLFDNRIPPKGFDYSQASAAGVRFWVYEPGTYLPHEDATRYGTGAIKNNFDIVTYRFDAAPNAVLTARAELYWQTHTRELMEHLKNNNTSTDRPQGPPSVFDPNYPLTPSYLSDQIPGFASMTDLAGNPLRDNWGGVAYAAWLLTGKGAPYLVVAADTAVTTPPAAPAAVVVDQPWDPDVPNVKEPFTQVISWSPVAGAEGYIVYIRYGINDATASWDKLAIVRGATEVVNTGIAVGKTYGYKVVAYNAAGYSAPSAVVMATTGVGLPDAPPTGLIVTGSTANSISLAWQESSSNEDFFLIERQDVPMVGAFYVVATLPTPHQATAGGVTWTDINLPSGASYNYRVAACNVNGCSTYTAPAVGSTTGLPAAPLTLTATATTGRLINLGWVNGGGLVTGFRIERSVAGPAGPWTNAAFVVTNPAATTYADATVMPNTTYWYRIAAFNLVGSSPYSNIADATTPAEPPLAPTTLLAAATGNAGAPTVTLQWTDNSDIESGFAVERALGSGPGITFVQVATAPANTALEPSSVIFTDTTGLTPATTYTYRVRAFNAGGNSAYTNAVVIVTVGTEPPQAPEQLRTVKVEKRFITLAWTDKATNETRYEVWRSLNGLNFTQIATLGINATGYQNNGLTPNTTYWYQVRACNATGCSAFSATISAKTKK